MDSKSYRTMTALLWMALPLTVLQFWTVWNQLPARMASHFGAAGQPHGWVWRGALAIFFLALLTFLLAPFPWRPTRACNPPTLAWALLPKLSSVVGVLLIV